MWLDLAKNEGENKPQPQPLTRPRVNPVVLLAALLLPLQTKGPTLKWGWGNYAITPRKCSIACASCPRVWQYHQWRPIPFVDLVLSVNSVPWLPTIYANVQLLQFYKYLLGKWPKLMQGLLVLDWGIVQFHQTVIRSLYFRKLVHLFYWVWDGGELIIQQV